MIKLNFYKIRINIRRIFNEVRIKHYIKKDSKIILNKIIPTFKRRCVDHIITNQVCNRIEACNQVIFRKCIDLMSGLSFSAHNYCALSTATNARSLLETVISFVAFCHKVEDAVNNKNFFQLHEEIRIYSMNSRNGEYFNVCIKIFDQYLKPNINKNEYYDIIKNIAKCKGDHNKQEALLQDITNYFNPGLNVEFVKQHITDNLVRYITTNILSEIKHLARYNPNIEQDYYKLSECCHPNYDSTFGLFARRISRDGLYFESNKKKLEEIQFSLSIVKNYMKTFYNKYNDLCTLKEAINMLENQHNI